MSKLYTGGVVGFDPGIITTTGGTMIFGTSGTAVTANTNFSLQPIQPKRKYWYKFFHYDCPLCGMEETIKQRIYDDEEIRPEEPRHRHKYIESPCGYHFM